MKQRRGQFIEMELSTRRPQASCLESQEWRRRIKCTCYYLPLRQAGHDRGMFASRLFSNASPSFTNSRRWLAANLLVVMCHFGALSCHFLLPYSWSQSTGSIYRKVKIMGSLLVEVGSPACSPTRMADGWGSSLLDRAEDWYNTLSGPGQNDG